MLIAETEARDNRKQGESAGGYSGPRRAMAGVILQYNFKLTLPCCLGNDHRSLNQKEELFPSAFQPYFGVKPTPDYIKQEGGQRLCHRRMPWDPLKSDV